MTSTRLLGAIRDVNKKRKPDVKIIVTDKIVIIEHRNGYEGFIAKTDPRAIKILNFIRL